MSYDAAVWEIHECCFIELWKDFRCLELELYFLKYEENQVILLLNDKDNKTFRHVPKLQDSGFLIDAKKPFLLCLFFIT